jgi:hypothetical protein
VILWRGTSLLLVLVVGGAALTGLLDWQIHLPGLVRALLLVGTLAGAGCVAFRYLLAPLAAKADDLTLALRVENEYPVLNDALASTVQFLQQSSEPKTGASPVLRREAVVRAMRLAQGCDFNRVVKARGVGLVGLAAAGLAGGTVLLFLWYPAWAWTALLRFGDPFGEHDWPRQTRIALTFPDRIAVGQPFAIRGEISGVIPEQATIELEGTLAPREVFRVVPDEGGKTGKLNARLDMTRQDRDFRFRVRANDAVDPPREGAWHRVRVAQPPRLAALNGLPSPQIELVYPAYTDKAPDKLSPGVGRIEAVAGTVATIRGATDRPVSRVWVMHRPDPVAAPGNGEAEGDVPFPETLAAVFLGPLGLRHPVETLALTAGGWAVWGRTQGRLDADGRRFTIPFMPCVAGTYVLHLEDAEGLFKEYEYDLQGLHPHGLADPVPVVNLERPASSQSVLAGADVAVRVLADDEFFAVRSVYLEFRRKDKDGKWLDARPGRLPLYDGPGLERVVQRLLSALAAMPLRLPGPGPHLRPRQVQVSRRWSLTARVKEGDILVLQACAHDFNDVAAFNVPGRSHEVELRVVGRSALQGQLDEAQQQIQQELIRLREWQEQALKKVIEAEQEWRQTGKLRPETLDKLLEAEQIQKQIQARVGAREDEGLRAELDRLRQVMRDNKLPPSGTRDRIDLLKSELDRLATQPLPQIEQRLADASKEHKDAAGAKIPSPRTEGNLGKARADQQEVQQTLEELLKHLDAWATRNEIRAETRAIQQEQCDLKQETDKLAEAFNKLGGPPDNQLKAGLRKNAELQRRLAERAQRLLDKMDRVSQDRLDELARLIDSAAGTPKARQELRALLEKRRALQTEVDRLENKLAPTEGERATLPKNAEALRRVEERLKELLAKAESTAQDRAEKDLATAEMLEKAAAIGRREMLVGEMRDTGDQIASPERPNEQPHFNLAQKQQKSAIDNLEKMIQALEERRTEEVERLAKKQRNAQKDLVGLMDEQDRLRKKAREALNNPDAGQRQEALAKLAEEQRKLEEEVTRKARELARLRASQAGQALGKAGQQMAKAAQQLDQGDDPDQAQGEAMERLAEAEEKLQAAQARLEDELAREQLAKIADQIKGLKERQDAAITESARIHQEVLKNNKWARALITSLTENARSQQNLAGETKGLKDKLKGAPAFEFVLDKAGQAMEAAAKRMEERADAAKGLQIGALEKEELDAENRADAETQKRQREAVRRLEHLLNALKPDDAVAQAPKKKQEDKQGGGQPAGGARGGGDGIPPVAQLKALRAEQQEVNDRTREFAEQHPNLGQLDQAQRDELQSIRAYQEQVFELFQRLMAAAQGEGDKK